MAKYLDKNAAIALLKAQREILRDAFGSYDSYVMGFGQAVANLSKIAAVDAEEVVRCKDCKFYYAWPDDYRTCHMHYQIDGATQIIGEMGFCSKGIPKEKENEQ